MTLPTCGAVARTTTVALLALSLALVAAASSGARTQAAAITSLTASGSPARPIFTVTGRGLAVPPASPATSPSGQPLCPLKITGNAGLDYGTALYLVAWDAQPADDNKQIFAAGRYRPALNELDCIGLVVVAHTPTRLTLALGHAYVQYRSQYRPIRNGDVVEVVVGGAAFATVVRYRG